MPETIPEHNVSLNSIDPRAMFALNPRAQLVTPDLFNVHWKRSRFSVANTGSLLATMLAGTESLLSDERPDSHYLGTQQAARQAIRRESNWPTPELSDKDTAVLASNGITATLFPTIIYRLTTWREHYGMRDVRQDISACKVVDSPPRIYEIDSESRLMLSKLWDIEISDEAYAFRQRTRAAHLPKRDVPRITRQSLAEARRQAHIAAGTAEPQTRRPRAVQPIRQRRVQ